MLYICGLLLTAMSFCGAWLYSYDLWPGGELNRKFHFCPRPPPTPHQMVGTYLCSDSSKSTTYTRCKWRFPVQEREGPAMRVGIWDLRLFVFLHSIASATLFNTASLMAWPGTSPRSNVHFPYHQWGGTPCYEVAAFQVCSLDHLVSSTLCPFPTELFVFFFLGYWILWTSSVYSLDLPPPHNPGPFLPEGLA